MRKLLTILLLFWTVFANATNYYVSSSSGSDGAAGTSSGTSWQTLNKVYTHGLSAGDTVFLKCGDTWNEQLKIPNSGSSGNPIVFTSYGTGAKPVITGLTSITSWTNVTGNIWQSNSTFSLSPNYLNLVVVGGNLQAIGRYPKNSTYTFQSHSGTSSITSSQISSIPSFVGGDVIIDNTTYEYCKAKVTAQTTTTVSYSAVNDYKIIGTYYSPSDNSSFFFQNSQNACTAQNDWYYDSSSKKLGMYSVGSPSNVQASTIDVLADLSSKSYITFNGIDFRGANSYIIYLNNSSNITISNCDLTYCGVDAIRCDRDNASTHLTVSNCNISYANDCAIQAGSVDPTKATDWTIQYCNISHIGEVAGMGITNGSGYSGIAVLGNNSYVDHNNVSYTGDKGIWIEGSTTTQYNYVIHTQEVMEDGGAIYTSANQNSPINIQNNIVLYSTTQSEGIYVDDNCKYVNILNNTVAYMATGGIYVHNSQNITIRGNTVYSCGSENATDNGTNQILMMYDNASNLEIQNIEMKNNIIVTPFSHSSIARFWSMADDIPSFGTFDSNYYATPLVSNPSNIFHRSPTAGPVWDKLSQWQTFSGQDAHSKKSPKTVTSTDSIRFEYNATSSSTEISLGATYFGIDSTVYDGYITLAPYSSAVLIYRSAFTNLSSDTTRRIRAPRSNFKFSYTNPVKDYLTMNIPSGYRQAVDFSLNDMWGRNFIKKKVQLQRGQNVLTVDMRKLSSAVYVASLLNDRDGEQHFKIVKINKP